MKAKKGYKMLIFLLLFLAACSNSNAGEEADYEMNRAGEEIEAEVENETNTQANKNSSILKKEKETHAVALGETMVFENWVEIR